MKVIDVMKKRMTFSFEVFPPKQDQPVEPLLETLENLYVYKPDFISCTYGAGGTNKGRSVEVCKAISDSGHTAMTHYTCIGNSKENILKEIQGYIDIGVKNVLALRGDIPEGQKGTGGDFSHGNEMLYFLKESFPELCVGAGCYPEKHIEAESMDKDIACLKLKEEAGADFFTTQLCHHIESFKVFMDKLDHKNIQVPIIAGIMPVLNRDATIRMAVSNGCSIPKELENIIQKYGDVPEDFKKAGKEFTAKLVEDYVDAGVRGIHLYSLNKYKDVADIIEASNIRERIMI